MKLYLSPDWIGMESWREMVKEATGQNSKTRIELLRLLVQANDVKEALYWAKIFEIPEKQWPWALSYYKDQNSKGIVFILSNHVLLIIYSIFHNFNRMFKKSITVLRPARSKILKKIQWLIIH